ncbi:MAG: carboxypeptidase-like regulatory domain-containing protein, partial [Opitutaceae bacterium]|nr:carboxypeptidase-like regulatory domain-containing protein [Opitutaceae bacterium]
MKIILSDPSRAPVRFVFGAICACLSLLAGSAFAQSGGGVITGRVINQATQEPLWNASITVRGTNLQTETDRDGQYRLTGVPEGMQTVTASYTGLDDMQAAVSVSNGTTATQNLALTAGYYAMDKVVVKSIKEGQSLAIQQQKLAPNSKVVSALDAYGNPSANPGELIQRLSEVTTEIVGSEVRSVFIRGMSPEFSVLQVDGQQVATSRGTSASREFQIEQMGTTNLQSIELIKAPRPQDDANSVAGFVNLISKRAFDSPGRKINLTLGTMWRTRDSGDNPFQDKFDGNPDVLALNYSDTFSVMGGEKNLGIVLNASHRRSSTTQDEVGAGLSGFGNGALFFSSPTAAPITRIWGTGDFFYTAIAESFSANVDYKIGSNAYVFLKTAYNTNDQDQRFYRWDILTGGSAANFTSTSTSERSEALPTAGSQAQTWSALFEKNSVNYSVNPGASIKLMDETAQLDLSYFYSYADIIYPNYNTGRASTNVVAPGGLGWSLDFRDKPYYPTFAQTSGPSVYEASSYTVNLNQHIHWWAPTENQNVKADFKKQFDWKVPVTLQTGAKYQINDQRQERDWENRTAWSGPT